MHRLSGLLLLALAGLAACDAGPKAVPAPPRPPPTAAATPAAVSPAAPVDPRDVAAPRYEGRPIWSSNRRMTAEENARSHFERNGADFGAKTVEEFVAKAHAFTSRPPKGVETIKRGNGDRLLYDAKTNTFAVVTRDGAPRTMFHPDNGPDYWRRQQRIEAERAQRD